MRNSLFVEFPSERTVFTDESYAAIGRALTYATAFESCCRALSSLNYVKTRAPNIVTEKGIPFEDALIKASDQIWDSRLRKHISQLIKYFEFPLDVKKVLAEAKSARNEIAHEITLGAAHWIETDKGQEQLLSRLHDLTIAIARGLVIVEFLALVVTNEDVPDSTFLNEYPEAVVKWVCEMVKET